MSQGDADENMDLGDEQDLKDEDNLGNESNIYHLKKRNYNHKFFRFCKR